MLTFSEFRIVIEAIGLSRCSRSLTEMAEDLRWIGNMLVISEKIMKKHERMEINYSTINAFG